MAEHFGGACPNLNFEETLSRAHGKLEEKIKSWSLILIIINYRIIINKHNNIINAQCNYYICNEGLLEECDKNNPWQ